MRQAILRLERIAAATTIHLPLDNITFDLTVDLVTMTHEGILVLTGLTPATAEPYKLSGSEQIFQEQRLLLMTEHLIRPIQQV